MFNIFRKKSQLEKLIDADGIEHATGRFAEIIARKLTSREIAYQFILQELDGASRGNDASQQFAESSGFLPEEYRNALENSIPEVDGPDGPQQQLLALSLELLPNQELVAKFRCMVDDKIMRMFKLGRYAQKEDRIINLLSTLKDILISDKDVIPAFTPNVPVPVGAQVRHIHNRQKNIASAKELISILSQMTRDDSETIIKKALSLDETKATGSNSEASLEQKYAEIAEAIVSAINQGGVAMVDQQGATSIVKETLERMSEREILGCKTSVASLFSMAHLADSAFKDNDNVLAKYISMRCKPIGQKIMQTPNDQYSDLEFTMVDSAFDIMKKIDGYA
ncbi:hypothetical protein [Noviherbaspirillum sp. UKPF54]|uniref:hypothetical protein n=1 Tax=Noviherbaspirillum sp. UKPF54 TaxID=2601898 RepID=UPI0011B163BF|nr:hypothetical protein [Noviherbaspirillum sp. UKPF54]QDZ27112.1 hypothetical protein FAY22_03520 [Noviherbaspirillum sp. UKPF54]